MQRQLHRQCIQELELHLHKRMRTCVSDTARQPQQRCNHMANQGSLSDSPLLIADYCHTLLWVPSKIQNPLSTAAPGFETKGALLFDKQVMTRTKASDESAAPQQHMKKAHTIQTSLFKKYAVVLTTNIPALADVMCFKLCVPAL